MKISRKISRLIILFIALLFVACGAEEESALTSTTQADNDEIVQPTAASAEDSVVEGDTTEPEDRDQSDGENGVLPVTEVNISNFYDGALANEVAVVECTLSDGTETTCYEITIAGTPANHEIGPFCPETTSTDAADAGIWLDGNGVYDVDGDFILGLAELYNDDNWKLYNDDGTVNITENAEEFFLAAQPQVDPSLYNHCVAGQIDWTESGGPVPQTVTIPIEPIMAGNSSAGGNWGITLNGVIIAASAPVDAILSAYTIAVFDDCGGHVNPFDGYHMHGARGCSEVGDVTEDETPIFAYALDGFPIHSPLSEAQMALVELDECNGHETEEHGYHYHANPAAENSVLTCFNGLTVGGGRPERGNDQGGRPDVAAAAEALGISEEALLDALGGPPPDFEAAAATLGITIEALEEGLGGTQPAGDAPTVGEADRGTNLVGTTIGTVVDSDFYSNYVITNDQFGTHVEVTVSDNERTMFTNSLPPWPADEFPVGNNTDISEQARTYTFPLNPVYVGNGTFERSIGVSVTGIKFDAGTAQRAQCENGVQYNVEAVNDLIPFGIDAHNAHVQNDGTYHYHNIPISEIDGSDLQHVGFALDGFLIYYSPTNLYPSSYQLRTEDREGVNCTYSEPDFAEITFSNTPDGTFQQDYEYIEGLGALDRCNGTVINGEYAYFVTDAYPHIPRCLNGEVQGTAGGGQGGQGAAPGGGGQGGQGAAPAGGGQGGAPDFAAAADALGVTEQALVDALGGPPPDFAAAAEILGVTEEALQEALGGALPPGGGGRGNGGGGGRGNGGNGGGGNGDG